jgi:hypothetical protein
MSEPEFKRFDDVRYNGKLCNVVRVHRMALETFHYTLYQEDGDLLHTWVPESVLMADPESRLTAARDLVRKLYYRDVNGIVYYNETSRYPPDEVLELWNLLGCDE